LSTLSDIKPKIKTIMEGISSVGKIHDYERWTNKYKKFLEFYKPDGQAKINGGEISRTSTTEIQETTGPRYLDEHTFTIRYYYSVDDSEASEKEADEIIEDIRAEFRNFRDLDGLCQRHTFIQVPVSEPRMFSNVLVHYIEMNLTVLVEI